MPIKNVVSTLPDPAYVRALEETIRELQQAQERDRLDIIALIKSGAA